MPEDFSDNYGKRPNVHPRQRVCHLRDLCLSKRNGYDGSKGDVSRGTMIEASTRDVCNITLA